MSSSSPISTTPISMSTAQSQWFSRPPDQRFETLDALQATVTSRAKRSYESVIDVSTLQAQPEEGTERGLMLISPKSALPLAPTHHGFSQLASRAGLHASCLRKLSRDLAAANLNYGLKNLSGNEEVKLMEVDSLDDSAQRAELWSATSPSYGRIWDADVVAAVQEIVQRTGNVFYNPKEWGGKPSGLYASDHDVFMFMIDGGSIVDGGDDLAGGDRDQLHRGFFCWNSEVGEATLGIQDFMFRWTCGNHMVWGPTNVRALKLRHTSGAPEKFVREAVPALEEFVNLSVDSYREGILAAKAYKTPDDKQEAAKFLRTQGFTNSEAVRAIASAEREEGGFNSLWLLVNGLTATARDMAFMDARVDLEKRAGKLIDLAVAKAA